MRRERRWELIRDWDRYQSGARVARLSSSSRAVARTTAATAVSEASGPRWRHRDARRAAAEIGWLHRIHGVGFVDVADENPTSSKPLWRAFLEALAEEDAPVQLVGTIRASNIVRDADILLLYKKAGFSRILMGIETTDADTLVRIRKGTTTAVDRQAIRLLRRNDILSQAAYVVGFEEETDRDYLRGLQQLLTYDPDQINAMYVTPHRWTGFSLESAGRRVVEPDQSRWDYRHQVLATRVPPWRVFAWVKLTEAVLQLRPRALWRVLAHRDRGIRRARRAWLFEVREFLLRRRRAEGKAHLGGVLGSPGP